MRPPLAALLVAWMLAAAPCAAAGEYAVVSSGDVDVTSLTSADLRALVLLDRHFWKPGHPVVLILPAPGSAARDFVVGHLCRSNEPALRRLYVEKMYRGEIDLAPKVAAESDARTFVASGRGVLAVLPVPVKPGEGLRVLAIDGRRPGEPGYPLHD